MFRFIHVNKGTVRLFKKMNNELVVQVGGDKAHKTFEGPVIT